MLRLTTLICATCLVTLVFLAQAPAPATEPASTPIARLDEPQQAVQSRAATDVAADVPVTLPLIRPGTAAPQIEADIRYVLASSVNVRESPSADSAVVGQLTRGEAARVLWTEENGWSRIILEGDGITGFVSGDYLSQFAPQN